MNASAAERCRGRPRRRTVVAWILWTSLAVLAAAGLGRHRIDNDLADWMPELVPTGAPATWVVIGTPAGLAPPAELGALAAALRERPEVGTVFDPATVTAAARFGGPAPAGLTGRPGDPMTATWVFAAPAVTDADLVCAVEAVLADAGLGVPPVAGTPLVADGGDAGGPGPHLAGPAVFRVAMNQWSQRGLPGISGLQGLLVFALLLAMTRRWSVALAGAASIMFVQLMLLGLFAWHDTPLDLALSLVPPLVAALGASFVLHRAMRRGTGPTIGASAVTTMLGLGVFAAGGLLPLLRFATWGATGVGLAALAAWMLVPGPKQGQPRPPRRRRPWPTLHRLVLAVAPRSAPVAAFIGGGVLVTAGAVAGALQFQTDPLDAFPARALVRADFRAIDAAVAGMMPFQLSVDGPFDPEPMVTATPGVRRLIPAPDDPGRWWGLASNDAVPAIGAAIPDWRRAAADAGATVEVRGVAAALAAIGHTVQRLAAASIPTMVLVAAVAGGLVARSWRAAAAAALVNAVPAAVLVLVAVIGGLDLGLPSLMIAAIATGAGIDDTVHLLAATRRHGAGRARARCLPACVASTVVAAAAMGLFLLSPFGPIRQFGGLMAVTLVAAMLADVLLLPALLGAGAGNREG